MDVLICQSGSAGPLPATHLQPTLNEHQLTIEQRTEQEDFMLFLQHELELRRAQRAAPRRSLRSAVKKKSLETAVREARQATVPVATPRPRAKPTRKRRVPENIQRKHELEGACLPEFELASGLTNIQRRWLLHIRLQPDQGETNWKLVAILFEDTFGEAITPEMAHAASDFFYGAAAP